MFKEEHYYFLYCKMPRKLASFSRVSLDIYLAMNSDAKYTQKPSTCGNAMLWANKQYHGNFYQLFKA